MANGLVVEGNDISDVRARVMRGEPQLAYLTINPVDSGGYQYDIRAPQGHDAEPTDRFCITYKGFGESFQRTVTGMKELLAVIKPIIQANLASKRALEQQIAKKDAAVKANRKAEILKNIKITEESLARMHRDLKALG